MVPGGPAAGHRRVRALPWRVVPVPLVRPSLVWVVVLDVAAWAVLSTAVGYAGHRLPVRWLTRDRGVLRLTRAESRGTPWRQLGIRRWKDLLPEAGALFPGGVSKRALGGHDDETLERMTRETRRAELVHWTLLVAWVPFLAWNPLWLAAVMVLYAVAANVPCLAAQRWNRVRLVRVLARRAARLR